MTGQGPVSYRPITQTPDSAAYFPWNIIAGVDMNKGLGIFAAVGLSFAMALPAMAEPANILGVFGSWSAYSSGSGSSLTCYALSKPRASQPKGAKRSAIYLMVSDWPSRKVKAEPQIIYGYQAKENGAAALGVGPDKFTFFIRNDGKEGSAWLQQLSDNRAWSRRCRAASRRWPAAPAARAPRPSIPTALPASMTRSPKCTPPATCDGTNAPSSALTGRR